MNKLYIFGLLAISLNLFGAELNEHREKWRDTFNKWFFPRIYKNEQIRKAARNYKAYKKTNPSAKQNKLTVNYKNIKETLDNNANIDDKKSIDKKTTYQQPPKNFPNNILTQEQFDKLAPQRQAEYIISWQGDINKLKISQELLPDIQQAVKNYNQKKWKEILETKLLSPEQKTELSEQEKHNYLKTLFKNELQRSSKQRSFASTPETILRNNIKNGQYAIMDQLEKKGYLVTLDPSSTATKPKYTFYITPQSPDYNKKSCAAREPTPSEKHFSLLKDTFKELSRYNDLLGSEDFSTINRDANYYKSIDSVSSLAAKIVSTGECEKVGVKNPRNSKSSSLSKLEKDRANLIRYNVSKARYEGSEVWTEHNYYNLLDHADDTELNNWANVKWQQRNVYPDQAMLITFGEVPPQKDYSNKGKLARFLAKEERKFRQPKS